MIKFGAPVQIEDIKAIGDEWRIDGYASTFGNPDDGDDIVQKGAFDRTLVERPKIAFLQSHDMRMVLGKQKSSRPDKKGLFSQLMISKTRLGEDARQLALDGALDSLSIGYAARDFEIVDGGYRLLKDVELYEVSLVPLPMNREAVVTNVKDYLSAIGIDPAMTMAEKAAALADQLNQLLTDTRSLTEKKRPLSETKRQELISLLETFSSLDAVRSDLTTILEVAPVNVSGKRVMWELSQRRRKLAHLLT